MVFENDPEVKKFMESEGRIYPGNDELDPATAKRLNECRAAIEKGEIQFLELDPPPELIDQDQAILKNWDLFKKKFKP